MNSLINEFNRIKDEISKYFGVEDLYDGFDDMRNIENWISCSSNGYDKIVYFEDGEEYNLIIQEVHSQEDLTLFKVRDGYGNEFWAIFDNSKKVRGIHG